MMADKLVFAKEAFRGEPPLLPARMVNEYSYCPRLAYLEWIQGEWAENADTVEGRFRHRRVDRVSGNLPKPEDVGADDTIHARSLTVSSTRLGVVARIDLLSEKDGCLVPVDYKKGKRPHVASGAYMPEKIQLCLQGLLLEEQGYTCKEGLLYFASSREKVRISFSPELRDATLEAVSGLRELAVSGNCPPPLEDSPKCFRCSLVEICLPDEINFLRKSNTKPRPLVVGHSLSLPLYIQHHKARVSKKGEVLEIVTEEDKPPVKARMIDVSQLVLQGNIKLTTPSLHELMRRDIPVTWMSYGGWFLGHTVGTGHKNVELRTAQYRTSFDEDFCRRLSVNLVHAKLCNARTLLRRNWRGSEQERNEKMAVLQRLARRSRRAESIQELLGIEGAGAAAYFASFGSLLKPGLTTAFNFQGRNRRPPADPVNALLSYAYSLLVRTISVTLSAVGFDPYRGYYHQPRYGRPSLSLDLMEPFRPLLADSVVIMVINNKEVREKDFLHAGGGVALTPSGRKRFIAAYERRLLQEITHPVFGYRISYRRLLEVQARLLGRFIQGEMSTMPQIIPR